VEGLVGDEDDMTRGSEFDNGARLASASACDEMVRVRWSNTGDVVAERECPTGSDEIEHVHVEPRWCECAHCHTRTILAEMEASQLPSGLHAHILTSPSCPSNLAGGLLRISTRRTARRR